MDRTAVDVARARVKELGGTSAAARALGWRRSHLEGWIRDPKRGLRPDAARELARFLGITFEAVAFKHESVAAIERRLREELARPRGPDRPRRPRSGARARKGRS